MALPLMVQQPSKPQVTESHIARVPLGGRVRRVLSEGSWLHPNQTSGSFDFEGAWLFNYGIGIHLIQSEGLMNCDAPGVGRVINPKDNHISFLCESVAGVEKKLEEMKIEYVRGRVEEGGIIVDQLFFHDPDGSMIEICNCDGLPVVPLTRNSSTIIQPCNCNSIHSQSQGPN